MDPRYTPPSPALDRAIAEIEAILGKPRDPVVEHVKLARRYWREAWKLRAGLIPHVREEVAANWSPKLKQAAQVQMIEARSARMERKRHQAEMRRQLGAARQLGEVA